jgi:hypothetical protein
VEIHAFPLLTNQYHDGTVQRSLVIDGVNAPQDLRQWRLAKRLSPANLATLQTFFEVTVKGGLLPFWMYDPYDVLPGNLIGSNYDPTGVGTQGRYSVFFRGNWKQVLGIGRSNMPELTLVQVA